MDIKEKLSEFKTKFEPYLEAYFKKKIQQASEIDMVAEEAVRMIKKYTMAGGKRIRPAVFYYGYLGAGGRNIEKILEVSMSVELLHSFLLIHDDVIDRDKSRHGVGTLHEEFKKAARRYNISKDIEHFGNSMAMIAGDMTAAMSCDVIFNSGFPAETVFRALDKLQQMVFVTIPGEMIDVIMAMSGEATEEQVMKTYEAKTARYTFEGPLQLGCLFAGGSDKQFRLYSEYALPLGKAFQIYDDILGVFGNEKKLGKPVGSDIIEGKQTLLILRTLKNGTKDQKKTLEECLGKKDLVPDELEKVKSAIRESGALKSVQNLAENFVGESIEALNKIDFKNNETKEFLENLARYMVRREL